MCGFHLVELEKYTWRKKCNQQMIVSDEEINNAHYFYVKLSSLIAFCYFLNVLHLFLLNIGYFNNECKLVCLLKYYLATIETFLFFL